MADEKGSGSRTGRLKRISHIKAKSGCFTCKARRVKCDEARPHCQRCIKFGETCSGYPVNRNKFEVIQFSAQRPFNRASYEARDHLSMDRISSPRFHSEDESRYFELFCNQTASSMTGLFDKDLWDRIILQTSEMDLSIRHAVIAVGALDMASKAREDGPPAGDTQADHSFGSVTASKSFTDIAEQRHVFALQQYGKAISGAKKWFSTENYDLRTALVASILIICFETYHGNFESATRQIRTSVKLLEQHTQKNRPLLSKSGEIEEELVGVFDRLDIQTASFSYLPASEELPRLKDSRADDINRMPLRFDNCYEARRYSNFVLWHAIHLPGLFMRSDHTATIPVTRPMSFWDKQKEDKGKTLVQERDQIVGEMSRWMNAFLPLFEKAKSEEEMPKKKEHLACLVLRAHFLLWSLSLKHIPHTEEVTYDEDWSIFGEIVQLGRVITEHTKSLFSMDFGCVYALNWVAQKCRDPIVRREAIGLLAKRPRREGMWDSVLCAKICWWIVQIEEQGMAEGFVPEESRARNVGIRHDFDNHQATVWCQLPGIGGDRNMRRMETVISW